MGPYQEVVFEGEKIVLDIPKEGVVLEKGWTITPDTYPGVSLLIQHSAGWILIDGCRLRLTLLSRVYCINSPQE